MQKKTLLIADDHPIFRQGMKQILQSIEWLKVVGEAESGESALSQIKYLKPDIVMLDIAMPGMDGLKVLEKASGLEHKFATIVVTSYDDAAYLERSFDLGAKAYVLKDAATNDLLECIDTVARGGMFISPSLGSHELKLPGIEGASTELLKVLTRKELEVLSLVADFKTSKQIARELDASYRTVQNHRAHICRKVDLHGPHQLMNFARRYKDAVNQLL
jgi:DNA-binding NarL/FixJ family response regulator